MTIPIVVPDIGAGEDPIRFVQWLVDDGDTVLAGDRVAEVIAAAVLFHVSSPAEGTLLRGDVQTGAILRVGTTLGVIAANGEETPVE